MTIYSKNNSVCACHASLVHDRARQRTLPCPVWLCGCVIMTTVLDLALFPPGNENNKRAGRVLIQCSLISLPIHTYASMRRIDHRRSGAFR